PGGLVDPSFNGAITLAVASGPAGATLAGTVSGHAAQGTTTFTGLSLDRAGTYTLVATTAGATAATTTTVAVGPPAASQLVVTTQPPGTVPFTEGFTFVVAAEDPYGNLATSFNQGVTAGLANTVGNGFAGGGVTVVAAAGVASFSNFFVGTPGTGYTIQ